MRRPFAGTGAEVLVDAVGVNGGAPVRFYDAESGGTQLTDLQTADGTPVVNGVITAGPYGKIPRFLGPNDGRSRLWADAGLDRLMLLATDLPERLAGLESDTSGLTDEQAATLAAVPQVVRVADTLTGFTLTLSGLAGGSNGYTLTGLPGSYPTETTALNSLLQALPDNAVVDFGGKTFAHATLTPLDGKKRLTFRNGGLMSTTLASSLQLRGCSTVRFEGFHLIAALMPADRTTAADEHANSRLMLDGCYDVSGDVRVIGSPNAGIILWDSSNVDLDADIAETRADGLNIHSGSRFVTVRAKVRRSGDDYVAAYSYEQAKPGWRWRNSGGTGVYAPPRDYAILLDGDGGNAKRLALASNGGQGGRGAYLSGENGSITGTVAGAAQAGILIGRIVNTGSAPYSTCRAKDITVLPGTIVDGNCLMSNDYGQVSVTAGGGVTGPEVDTVTVSRVKIKGTTGLSAMAVIPNADLHTAADAMVNVRFTDNYTYSTGSLYGGVIATGFVYGGDDSPWFIARRNARVPNADWSGTPLGWALEIGTSGQSEVTPETVAAAGAGVFVMTAQAATVVFDWDDEDTGDLVISAGGKTARLAFIAGELQGGSGGTTPPTADYEADVDFRWDSAHMPTGAPTTNLWAATKPSSGGPTIQWSEVGNHSGPAAGAFGTGVPGYTIGVDGARVDLGSLWSVEPAGTGGGFVAMSCKNVLWDSAPASTGDTSWVLSLYGRDIADLNNLRRVQAALYYTGGGWNWRVRVFNGTTDVVLATVPVEVNVVDFPDDNQHGVGGPMVLAWKLAGPDSAFIVASAEGTQTIPVDLTGIGDFKFIYFAEEPSGVERTTVTMKAAIAGADNWTGPKIDAAVADLADDANFTIGA